MNDRFMFRVWDKYTHETPAEEMQFLCFDGCLVDCDGCYHSPDDYVIEQCTGLKDKNGKLIYEGDVVKIPDDWETYGFMSGEKREVYFRDGGFRLKPKDTKLGRGHWLEQTSALEIIGNIHEQPEQKDTK